VKQFTRFLYFRIYSLLRKRLPFVHDRELVSLLLVVLLFSFNGYSLFLLLPKAMGLNYSWLWVTIPGSIIAAMVMAFLYLFGGKFWLNPSVKSLHWWIYRARAGKLLAFLYVSATFIVLFYLLSKV